MNFIFLTISNAPPSVTNPIASVSFVSAASRSSLHFSPSLRNLCLFLSFSPSLPFCWMYHELVSNPHSIPFVRTNNVVGGLQEDQDLSYPGAPTAVFVEEIRRPQFVHRWRIKVNCYLSLFQLNVAIFR